MLAWMGPGTVTVAHNEAADVVLVLERWLGL